MFASYFQGARDTRTLSDAELGAGRRISSRKFDALFLKYGGPIPVAYLRALAHSESRLNPHSEQKKGIDIATRRLPSGKRDSYWGLFQVGVRDVLPGYNKRNKTSFKPVELFNAEINTAIAVETLRRIIRFYEEYANKFGIDNFRTNFDNPEFVKLLTAGWNSGYSRAAGVQKVAKYLVSRGLPITHQNVFLFAKKATGTKHLQNFKKRDYQIAVTNKFFRELGRKPLAPRNGGGPLLAAGILLAAGLAALASRG